MNELEGFVATEIEPRGKFIRMLKEFLRTGNECMGKRYSDRAELTRDYNGLKSVSGKYGIGVKVSRRGDMLYLINKEGESK